MGLPGLFVTGTDTDVGKTTTAVAIVAALVREGWRVGVYKPVASGLPSAAERGGDACRLWDAAGRPLTPQAVCPQVFSLPLAPQASARAEGRRVDERLLIGGLDVWIASSDVIVVEGAGGLFSPAGDTLLNVDVARELAFPIVVVDAAKLGLIGRTLATVRAARAEGLRVAAVVLSEVTPPREGVAPTADEAIVRDGRAELMARLPGVPVAILAHGATAAVPTIDWSAVAGCPAVPPRSAEPGPDPCRT